MKPPTQFYEKRSFWLSGSTGFIFAGLLSLAGGNLPVTSLLRGLGGMLAVMALYWIFTRFYQSLQQGIETGNAANAQSNATGSNFDVSIPAEVPSDIPQAADFQPWAIGESLTITDEQAKQIAETLREMKN